MDPVLHPRIPPYLESLLGEYDEPDVLEMETLAAEREFPIVGRLCGSFLEVMALSVRAGRVFEFGSGFGYSAYWFSRAVGKDGEVICTEGDADNVALAESFLRRVGRWSQVTYHCGWAQEIFPGVEGDFDVIYNDANKEGYPGIWEQARGRIRPGGLYMADNTLWQGQVADPEGGGAQTLAIKRHNDVIFADPDFDSFLYPVRDGIVVARRKD